MAGRPRKIVWTKERLDEIEGMAAIGLTLEEMAVIFGCDKKTVSNAVQDPVAQERYRAGFNKGKRALLGTIYKRAMNKSDTLAIFLCKTKYHMWDREREDHMTDADRAKLARDYLKKLDAGEEV